MKKTLVPVASAVISLAAIRAMAGESPLWIPAFFLVLFAGFELFGDRQWRRAVVGALAAAAFFMVYMQVSGELQANLLTVGFAVCALAVAVLFALKDRSGHQHRQ